MNNTELANVSMGTILLGGSMRYDHYCLYRDTPIDPRKATKKLMVFNGMDHVIINDNPSTHVSGCWKDIKSRPKIIKELVGSKGLAFLKLLVKQQAVKGRVLFTELQVISAWQFTIVSTGRSTKPMVSSALREHLGIDLKFKKWNLEKKPFDL